MFSARTNWSREKNRLSLALEEARRAGKRILDLTASNPTRCGLAAGGEDMLRALADPRALTYDPDPRGLASARQAISGYYASHAFEVSPDDVLLTASTSEAYSYLFRALCNPADEILVPAPSYPLFDFLATIQDVRVERYPLLYDHGWQIDLHALKQKLNPRSKAILVVNPNNPTGHFAKPPEIAELNELAARHDLALIADEVFWDFRLGADLPPLFVSNSSALTFTLSGLSKICGLPQMKAAWIVARGPKALKTEAFERLEIIADTYLSVGTPVQYALPKFLEMRHAFQSQLMERVRRNLAVLDLQLAAHPACSRLQIEGGWYAVVRVPVTRSDEDLAVELLRSKGVYLHPGHFYDFSGEGNLVVSLVAPEADFAGGIAALLSLV
jgi:alanine-synthesizing transaminase